MKERCHKCGHSTKHRILHELKHHAPFTLTATLIAIVLVLIFRNIQFGSFFEVLHPLHLLVSAMATSAMYYKYNKKPIHAFFVGILGAIIIGSFSDVIFPHIGGLALGINIQFHLPLIEETGIVLLSAIIGTLIGMKTKITKEPHAIHVLLSVFASLFYLLAYSGEFAIIKFILITVIVFIAVLIPCCISDIVFPLWFVKKKG